MTGIRGFAVCSPTSPTFFNYWIRSFRVFF
jgi:hypothetical protein